MRLRWLITLYALLASHAMGDGAYMLARGAAGPWLVTLFAPEDPLRAGSVDLSILVQDERTGEPSPDVEVVMETPSERIMFGHRANGNRILYRARPVLQASREVPAEIIIRGGGQKAVLRCSLRVASAENFAAGYVLCFAALPAGLLVAWWKANRFRRTGG